MFEKAIFYDYTETEKGAWFKVHVPGWFAPKKLIQKWMSGAIRFDDGRSITSAQNKLIHALIGDVAKHYDYHPSERKQLKEDLKLQFAEAYGIEVFSISDLDVPTATEFIDYLIEFMLLWDIEMSPKVNAMARTTNNWIYYHIMNGKCVCCQRDKRTIGIHLHHTNPIGMGRDRKKVDHSEHKFLTLCADHHQEAHTLGQKTFNARYHLDGIKLSKESLVELRVMKKCDLTELEEAEAEVNGEHHMQPLWMQGGKETGSNL